MGAIKGVPVTLYTVEQTGTDEFNEPIYKETPVKVNNVLITPTTQTEALEAVNLYGRKAVYTLGIPKGDTHEWENRRVDFFGQSFRVFGIPTKGIDALIPLGWNMKVTVERYE